MLNQSETAMRKQLFLLFTCLGLILLTNDETYAQSQRGGGFYQMNGHNQVTNNRYVTIDGVRDTIQLFDQYGNFRKDTIVVNSVQVKDGVWLSTDADGNQVRRVYRRGELVSGPPEDE